MDDNSRSFFEAFIDGDVARAESIRLDVPDHDGICAHPLLVEFVAGHRGHCYKRAHLQIADLLIPSDVRQFRDAILADRIGEVRSQLRERPELVNAEFTAGRGIARPMHHFSSIAIGELLLDAGADVDALNSVHDGETPLVLQVRFGSLERVRWLLERGANPNLRPRIQPPSETMAALIALLLEHGWDIQRGHQLLHDAKHGLGQRIQTWLEFGADPNTAGADGATALHVLAARGTGREAIRALVVAGADVNCRDQQGQTPLEIARTARQQSAAQELAAISVADST